MCAPQPRLRLHDFRRCGCEATSVNHHVSPGFHSLTLLRRTSRIGSIRMGMGVVMVVCRRTRFRPVYMNRMGGEAHAWLAGPDGPVLRVGCYFRCSHAIGACSNRPDVATIVLDNLPPESVSLPGDATIIHFRHSSVRKTVGRWLPPAPVMSELRPGTTTSSRVRSLPTDRSASVPIPLRT